MGGRSGERERCEPLPPGLSGICELEPLAESCLWETAVNLSLFTQTHQKPPECFGNFHRAWLVEGVLYAAFAAPSLGRSCSLGVCDPSQDKMKTENRLAQSGPLPTPYMYMLSPAGSMATTLPVSPGQTWGSWANFGNDCGPAAAISVAGGGGPGEGMCCSVQRALPTLFPHPAWLSTLAGVPL